MKQGFHTMNRMSFVRYVGGKHRLAPHIAEHLHATGRSCLVDVFGGSGAVVMNAGFKKRVYNDLDSDLVHLFKVIADPALRQDFLRRCKWTVPSRKMFNDDHEIYRHNGLSFRTVKDPVDRALKMYFRLSFCFGGKVRSGGFQVSPCDREPIKEVSRWNNMLRRIVHIGHFWRNTVIENQHYQDCIKMYGGYKDVVLFCDPPYVGTEDYYSITFRRADHVFLAEQLLSTPAPVVCTYYDDDLVRSLYPEEHWEYFPIQVTKNSNNRWCKEQPKQKASELIIVKRMGE